MGLKEFFVGLVGWLRRALSAATANGLTDEIVRDAYWLVKEAATRAMENEQARGWVLSQLVAKGIPESIARTSLELALQILKRERPTT